MTKYFQNILISLVLVSCNGKYTTAETYSEEPLGGSANLSTGGIVENSGGSIVENTGGVIENTGESFPDNTGGTIPDNTGGNASNDECSNVEEYSCNETVSRDDNEKACFLLPATMDGDFDSWNGGCSIILNDRVLSPEDLKGSLESGILEISGCSYWFYRGCL